MIKFFASILVAATMLHISAQNPIVPPGMYIADPEAHVWADGNIYIYGSRDESDEYWCSYTHHVLSSNDLLHWTVNENAFASMGENDEVAYHDKLLFAPDCAYKNGRYYLYYCSPGDTLTEGVATSTSPIGPFTGGKEIKGAYQIDPAVLIDDDGQAYYLWGQGKAKMARLKPNMIEIDKSTISYPLDSAGNLAFHEGSSIRKISDTYYLVFADESRNGRPTCLGYATNKNPMGSYAYQGVIIDNAGSDPSVWNNHGSIEKFNGQWYVFYHRATNNSQKFRKACIEPININADGTIDEVEMTTQGALGKPLDATAIMQAERACYLSGKLFIKSIENSDTPNEGLGNIFNGDYAAYKYLQFHKGINEFKVKTTGTMNGNIEIRLDAPNGKLIGTCNIPNSKNATPSTLSNCGVSATEGVHSVYLVFKSEGDQIFEIDWFQFL